MKKKVIALLLSLVLATGSISIAQVQAAETTEQEAVPVEKEEPAEDPEAEPDNLAEDISNQAEEEETVQETGVQIEENEDVTEPDSMEEISVEEDAIIGEEEDADLEDTTEDAAAALTDMDEAEDALAATGDVVASGSCGDDSIWTLTGTGSDLTLTISGSGWMDDLSESSIPWASNRAKVKRVIVEDGITHIGDYAFYSLNRMTDVSLPDSLCYIGEYAFADCKALKSISIPDSVKSIYGGAFSGCNSLANINLPDGLTVINWSLFSGCSSLESIIIPNGVTEIGAGAFSDCSRLKSINLPEGLEEIRGNAFNGCNGLTSISFPDSITYLGEWAFSDCGNLKTVYISDLEGWFNIDFGWGNPGFKADLYLNNHLVTEVVVPDGITEMSPGPLAGITSVKRVILPDSVTSIADYCFSDCTSLTSIEIPDSVMSIGYEAFKGCTSLKDIAIPESIETIESGTFRGCTSLTSIKIPDSIKIIEDDAFRECTGLTSIQIPDGVTSIGGGAFFDCPSMISMTIPDSVTNIEGGAIPKNWEKPTIVFTHNQCVKDFCEDYYDYFDSAAPAFTQLTGQNGSDIWAKIEKRGDATGYHIKYADNSNMKNAKEIMVNGKDSTSKAISGLKNGKTYYVQVQIYKKMWNTTYWSKWSPVKSVKVEQKPYPTNVSKLSTYIGSHIKVDWTKTAGASGYHIKYADNSDMTGAKEVMIKGNSTFTKTLTGLKNGKTYYVKIQTYRTVSGKTYWSSWSKAKSIKVDQIPYGSSIKKLTKVSSTKMKITWDKASSASGYHLQYTWYGDNGPVTKDIIINGNSTLSKTITGLSKNTYYDVRIQTFRKVSGKTYWSSWSKVKGIYIY